MRKTNVDRAKFPYEVRGNGSYHRTWQAAYKESRRGHRNCLIFFEHPTMTKDAYEKAQYEKRSEK